MSELAKEADEDQPRALSSADRLRAYLAALPRSAKALLATEFERARQRGEELPGADLVLSVLRSSLREEPETPPEAETEALPAPERAAHAARVLFRPLDPYLIDERLEVKTPARIMRQSLGAIWTWIVRDLDPAGAKAFEEKVAAARGEAEAEADCAAAFFAALLPAINDKIQLTENARKRLIATLGDERVLEDLADLAGVMPHLGLVASVPAKLPSTIKNLADEGLENVCALLEPIAARRPGLLPYALSLVQARLVQRHHLVRVAVAAVESDDPQRIIASPYRAAVDLVVADAERAVLAIAAALKARRLDTLGPMVREFHNAMRTLRTDMNMSGDGPWQKRLSKCRGVLAGLLTAEIEGLPGQIRRMLRMRQRDDMHRQPVGPVQEEEVAEVENRLELLVVCRNYASEIALNEVTLRIWSEIQGYLDPTMTMLLDAIRSAPDVDRALRIGQIDAGVRFSAKIFGASYAQLLQKAADVAIQSAKAR